MSKLTDARCRNAKPSSKDQWLSDGSGLYLRIRPGGSKTWVVRAKRGGKSTVTTLEPYTDMSLKEARLEAATIAVEKKITNTTVARLIAQYTDDVICHHKRPVMATGYMDRAIRPALGTMRVRDVRRTDVVCVIQGYISNGRRTADQLRSQLRSLFSYAVELGYIEHNPAAEISTRVTGYTYKPRERVLTDAEIKHIWHEQHGHARLMRFLLLTGVRIGEARNGQPHDAIDNIWTIPAEISKNGRAHRVQLSDTANEQLSAPWVASGTAAQAWVKRYCFRHEIEPAWTPHDLRRTFATRLNELGTSPHVVERCLNHTMQGVMAVYNRAEYHDERLKSYKLIESHVLEVVSK